MPKKAYTSVRCFVLLELTPKVYRVPRVFPGVPAPKLFPPTSVAGYADPRQEGPLLASKEAYFEGALYQFQKRPLAAHLV